MKLTKVEWILISYFIVNFIVMAFIWKYIPLWQSLLMIVWVIVSTMSGYILAYIKYKGSSNQ